MCGRFALYRDRLEIEAYFECEFDVEFTKHYNIPPSQKIPVITETHDNKRKMRLMRWGLIPSWMKAENISSPLINARVETAFEKPSFRHAFKKQRCIIIADGFYEWQESENKKQPFYIHRRDLEPLAFAGIWEHWINKDDGTFIDSCAILTTSANQQMSQFHDRMPVMLGKSSFQEWLSISNQDVDSLNKLLSHQIAPDYEIYPVNPKMNKPQFDSPECLDRM